MRAIDSGDNRSQFARFSSSKLFDLRVMCSSFLQPFRIKEDSCVQFSASSSKPFPLNSPQLLQFNVCNRRQLSAS